MRLGNLFFSANKTRKIPSRAMSVPLRLVGFCKQDDGPIDGCLCLLLGQYRAVLLKQKCLKGVIDSSINAAQFLRFEHPFAKVFVRCFLVEVYG